MTVRIDWNLKAFDSIRRDPAVKSALRAAGDRVRSRCGEGYVVTEHEGKSRSRVHVSTGTTRAKRDHAKHATLARARDAA